MPRSSQNDYHVVDESYPLEDSNQPSTSARDGDPSHYMTGRPRRSILARAMQALAITSRRQPQRSDYDYFSAPTDADPDSGLAKKERRKKKPAPRDLRSCRRTRLLGFVKRTLLALPIFVLIFFGCIHILQTVLGRARLFWDGGADDEFLPDWGKPGHAGEGLTEYPTDATRDVIPIPCHSHNDYWRRVPLFEALHWGCTGVEADVWNFDDELYVGHNLGSLTRNRTFRSLYLDPILDLLDRMNPSTPFANVTHHGVFDEDPTQPLILLVDFKTDGYETFPVVEKQLEALRAKDYLTYWNGTQVVRRLVTVVGTGNTPFDLVVRNTTYRDIFFDAPLDQLWEPPRPPSITHDEDADEDPAVHDRAENSVALTPAPSPSSGQGTVGTAALAASPHAFNTSTSYYASTSFLASVGLVWRGHLSPRQMALIRGQIRGARRRGLRVRYWDTPAWPVALRNHVWHVLVKEGADVLNVDDLRAAATTHWRRRMHPWW